MLDLTCPLKNKIRKSFNKAAFSYDQYAQLQRQVGQQLIIFLKKEIENVDRIIDLGCGTGVITQALATNLEFNQFDAIDVSNQFVLLAKKRLAYLNISVSQKDFDDFNEHNMLYNVVFSNMALHWSLDLNKTFFNIYQNLEKKGLLVFSLPLAGTLIELKKYSRNNFNTPEEIKNLLIKAGFKVCFYSINTLLTEHENIQTGLRSIKAIGANCLLQPSFSGLRGKSFLKELCSYEVDQLQRFLLTYNIGYFIARKN